MSKSYIQFLIGTHTNLPALDSIIIKIAFHGILAFNCKFFRNAWDILTNLCTFYLKCVEVIQYVYTFFLKVLLKQTLVTGIKMFWIFYTEQIFSEYMKSQSTDYWRGLILLSILRLKSTIFDLASSSLTVYE